MHAAFSLDVGGMGLCGRVESPYVCLSASRLQFGLPAPGLLVPINAKESALIVGLSGAPVLFVKAIRHLAQVAKAVIRSIAVNVVNLQNGPFARHVEPCEPMGVEMMFKGTKYDIAKVLTHRPEKPALWGLAYSSAPTREAPKVPHDWVVPATLAKGGNGYFGVCHGR